ncbi:MAG: helix-turn-helix domain-containing protein [Rhodospirillales bacterium]|nr:helix-turn-helix domain-containing protein [Rhodospirillales bacterium]
MIFSIGGMAARTGCKVETIRYYEKMGLLAPPPRTRGGHRSYDLSAYKRLNFILRARRLGFPLSTVRTLLELADGEEQNCAQVGRIANARLEEVRRKIGDLTTLETTLALMVDQCRSGKTPDCPLIEALFEGGESAP